MKRKFNPRDIGDRAILLESDIRNRQLYMLNTANSGMLELFWGIGEILNESGNSLDGALRQDLAAILQTKYGRYFSVPALAQMQEFCAVCPSRELRDVSMGASWAHIPILCKFAHPSDWVRYADMIYLEQLSPEELEEKIKQVQRMPASTDEIPIPSIFDKALIERFMDKLGYDQFFRVGMNEDFRKLFELRPLEKTITHIEAIDSVMQAIDRKVDYFRKSYHTTLHGIGYGAFSYVVTQITSAHEVLAERTDMKTILERVSGRFNGQISADWLDLLLKSHKANDTKEVNTVLSVEKKTYQEGNINMEITMTEVKEDIEAGTDIYNDPDIMYFLEQA